MSKNVDFKVVGVIIILIAVIVISRNNWEFVSEQIFRILKSRTLTTVIWGFIILFSVIHYYKNHTKGNTITEKTGLEKPIDYIQFAFTFSVIGMTIQTTARELFAQLNFAELSKCSDFDNYDCFGFFTVIVVLVVYTYGKVKPVIIETIQPKENVDSQSNDIHNK